MDGSDARGLGAGRARWCGAALVVLAAALASTGCDESLFGTRSHGGDPVDDGGVPVGCGASCIADAARDFDAAANGGWQYLGDRRDRTWSTMTAAAGAMVGDASNRVARCADNASAPACAGQQGALLVTTSGAASASDPAVSYVAAKAGVVRLAVRASVPPDGVAHRVRLYRNSREDALITAITAPGATVADAITVDALAGDRFLVALEPTGAAGGSAALAYFVIDPHQTFPAACALALSFADETLVGMTVDDLCGRGFTFLQGATPAAPLQVTGPYPELASGLYFEDPYYLAGTAALPGGDRTVQLWVLDDAPTAPLAWVFSDVDEASGAGLGIRFAYTDRLRVEAAVVSSTSPVQYASQGVEIPPTGWHFVRVVHAGGTVTLCVDGARSVRGALPGPNASTSAPRFGRNTIAFDDFRGSIDDVRVIAGALPCP